MRVADLLKSIFISLACLASTGLGAQVLTEQDLLLQPNELLNAEYSGNGNDATINQTGNRNEVDLLQMQEAAEGNLARVLQDGRRNFAIITQVGAANQLALIQNGNRNMYELYVEGTGNQMVAIQDGRRNSIIQSIENSSNIYSEMVQIGNDNEIITVIEGIQGQEFIIRQIGDGLKAEITQSAIGN